MNASGSSAVKTVGIVIVSHSGLIAEGAADMARQMVGNAVPIAWCGGNPEGGLGSDIKAIAEAIEKSWTEQGVAIFVDLGSTEMNSEMAIEALPDSHAERVMIMDAPLVEGVIIATTTAAGGASLEEINMAVKDLSR